MVGGAIAENVFVGGEKHVAAPRDDIADLAEGFGVGGHEFEQRTELGLAGAGAGDDADFLLVAHVDVSGGTWGEGAGVGERDF